MNRGRQYKTVKEFYQPQLVPKSTLYNDSFNVSYHEKKHAPKSNYTPVVDEKPVLNMQWESVTNGSLVDPKIWGPSFWFSLHNGSLRYPQKASKIVAEKMKNFIIGIPYILPCADCAEHARAHIEKNYSNLDAICSGRDNLFCFFVDFHNYVNRRYNKAEMSCHDAKKLYSGGANVMRMTYK